MTDINRDNINKFVRGLSDQQKKSKEEAASTEQAPEKAPQASQSNTAVDPDKMLGMMSANAAPIQQFMSVQSSLAKFDPFLQAIEEAFTSEFGGHFATLGEAQRRELVLRAANDLMDKNLV